MYEDLDAFSTKYVDDNESKLSCDEIVFDATTTCVRSSVICDIPGTTVQPQNEDMFDNVDGTHVQSSTYPYQLAATKSACDDEKFECKYKLMSNVWKEKYIKTVS